MYVYSICIFICMIGNPYINCLRIVINMTYTVTCIQQNP